MLTLHPDFKEFLNLLNEQKVKYIILGGYAVVYHGYPRSTGDIDVWVQPTLENAKKVVQAVRAFGFSIPNTAINQFKNPGNILRMGLPPVRIEVMTSVSGLEFDSAYTNRINLNVSDTLNIPVISLADLKANKSAAGRAKDLEDLKQLP